MGHRHISCWARIPGSEIHLSPFPSKAGEGFMYVTHIERIKEQSGNSLEKGFSPPCSVVGRPCDIARALWELNSLVSVPKSEHRQPVPGSLGL